MSNIELTEQALPSLVHGARAASPSSRDRQIGGLLERICQLPSAAFLACALMAGCTYAAASDSAPTIWFAPLDSIYRPWQGYSGSADYMDLFAPDAPWPNAAAHVKVFKIYVTLLTSYSDQELKRMFADLKRRQIALALEFAALTLPRGSRCPRTEGYDLEGAAADYARRIKQAGGVLQYVAMDEPFYFAAVHVESINCQRSVREVAQNAVANLNVLKKEFPDLQVGDIEPVPAFEGLGWIERYREWVEAYRAAAGTNLAFLHADIRWNSPTWKQSATDLAAMLKQQGIPFGMIYNASADGPNEWMLHAAGHFVEYEQYAPALPDQVIFQSWHPDPKRVLPETDGRAFTSLINRYVNRANAATTGTQPLPQAKTGAAGSPVVPASAPTQPIATIRGTVPASATAAVAAIRVNAECKCQGSSDLTVFSLRYRDGSERGQATTLDFGNGFQNWWLKGDATLRLEMVTGLEGLRILASPQQAAIINSPPFGVTPGAAFVLEVFGRVPPESMGSGLLAVIFRSNSAEVARVEFPM
jgi:hypothetical protein